MRIAVVAQPFDAVLPPVQNSIGIIVFNTARWLARRAEVSVFLPAGAQGAGTHEQDGVRFIGVPCSIDTRIERTLGRYPNWFGRKRLIASGFYYGLYISRIAAKVRSLGFDVVHIMNFPQFARVTRSVARRRTRISLEMQCDWLTQWERRRVVPGLWSCDYVWGVSRHVTELIRDAFPELPAQLGTTYNGVEPARFARSRAGEEPERRQRILFVGRLSPEKGIHVLIEAVARLVRRFPELELVLVGPRTQLEQDFLVGLSDEPRVARLTRFYDGTVCTNYQRYLEERVRALGIAGKVVFRGSVPQEDLVAEYRRAAVLANPSFSESFGMSLVEAMAGGCAVVATRVGGMQDIVVHGETGYLVDSDDVDELAAALTSMLEDPLRRAAMVEQGRRRALETFSWEARADRLWRAFVDAEPPEPGRSRTGTIRVGAGAGLRFDAGASNRAYESGDNELPVQQALTAALTLGSTFFDVGANVGFFSVIGARLVGPNGRVYAFEPVQANALYIRRNASLNGLGNVEVMEQAVSSSSGRGRLVLTDYAGGAALASATRPIDASGEITVDLVSIDDLVFRHGMPAPTVVKIDVEGAEIDVLRGMARTLAEAAPTLVYEIDDAGEAELRLKQQACEELLHGAGYHVEPLPDSYPRIRWFVRHFVARPGHTGPREDP